MRVVTINALNRLFLQPVRERPIEISALARVTRRAKPIAFDSQQGPRGGLVNRVARETIERVSIVRAKQPPAMGGISLMAGQASPVRIIREFGFEAENIFRLHGLGVLAARAVAGLAWCPDRQTMTAIPPKIVPNPNPLGVDI